MKQIVLRGSELRKKKLKTPVPTSRFPKHVNQQELGVLFALSPIKIPILARKGIVVRGPIVHRHRQYLLEESCRNYIKHLREIASQHKGGEVDLVEENGLLRRQQRLHWQLKNRILEANVVEVGDLAPAWSRVVLSVRAAMLALPNKARMAMDLDDQETEALMELVRGALTEAAFSKNPPAIPIPAPRGRISQVVNVHPT